MSDEKKIREEIVEIHYQIAQRIYENLKDGPPLGSEAFLEMYSLLKDNHQMIMNAFADERIVSLSGKIKSLKEARRI